MKPGRLEAAVLVLFLGIISYQLFIPPAIGMADNGDFARFFYPVGLKPVSTEYFDNYFHYFNSRYWVVARPTTSWSYTSSTIFFVRAARWFNIHFRSRQDFDVRVLGAVYLSVFLLGIHIIMISSRRLQLRWRIALAALLLFMFTDAAYTAYFNSFYSEATALVCLVILIGCSLVLIAGQSRRWVWLAGYFIASAILITAKPMYVPSVLLFGPFGIYLSKLTSLKYRYWLSAAAACALLPLSVVYFRQTPDWLRLNAGYMAVFTTLLETSPHPEQVLRDLELNPEWIRYAGTTPYQRDSPAVTDAGFRAEFLERIHTLTVPKFFITHPAEFYRVASRNARLSLTTRPSYAGYYEKESGRPAYTKAPAHWSAVRSRLFPASVWFLIVYFASGVLAITASIRKSMAGLRRGFLLFYSLLVAFSAVIFLVPVLTVGDFDPRYSSTFAFAFDVTLILAVGALLGWIGRLRRMDRTFAWWRPQLDSQL